MASGGAGDPPWAPRLKEKNMQFKTNSAKKI